MLPLYACGAAAENITVFPKDMQLALKLNNRHNHNNVPLDLCLPKSGGCVLGQAGRGAARTSCNKSLRVAAGDLTQCGCTGRVSSRNK